MSDQTVEISVAEFQKLQQSVLEYKQRAFDAEEKGKKIQQQLQAKEKEKGVGWFGSSNKDKELQKENENLQRTISQLKEEFGTQSFALKENMRSLFSENEKLQQQIKQLQTAGPAESSGNNQEEIEKLKKELSEKNELLEQANKANEEKLKLSEENEKLNKKLEELNKSNEENKEQFLNQIDQEELFFHVPNFVLYFQVQILVFRYFHWRFSLPLIFFQNLIEVPQFFSNDLHLVLMNFRLHFSEYFLDYFLQLIVLEVP